MKKWLDKYKSGGSANSLNRKVTCSNCGWSWKLSNGGMDPMTCHKCGGDIKMQQGGELDEYQDRGQVNFRDQLFQRNKPIIDATASPILLPPNLNYDKKRVVNSSSAGLNKNQLKQVYKNLKTKADAEKKQEIEEYEASELFHKYNPVAQFLGTRSAPVSSVKPTPRELAYGLGAGINEFYDVPNIGIVNDFVNPLSLVSKGIISPWAQAPLQAQQSDSYLPYAGAALSTALTVPMVRPAATFAKTVLNPRNIYRGALRAGKYINTSKQLPGFSNIALKNINQTSTSNLFDNRIIDDIVKKEVDWLNSEEYIKRKMKATGKTKDAIIKERDEILNQFNKTELTFTNDKSNDAFGVYSRDKNKPAIYINNTTSEKHLINTVDHELKHALSEAAIVKSNDPIIQYFNNPYRKYPKLKTTKWYDNLMLGQNTRKWANLAPEQQVASKRIMDLLEKNYGIRRGTELNDNNIQSLIDHLKKEIKSGDMQNSDLITMLHSVRSTHPKNYRNVLKNMINNAYFFPTTIGVGAALNQKQQGGPIVTNRGQVDFRNQLFQQQKPIVENTKINFPKHIQQIPIDPFTHQPLTREQIQMQKFVTPFNKPQPTISQGTWKGNRKTKDNFFDPYLRIIEQDPESEANIGKRKRKELVTKKLPAALGAATGIVAAPTLMASAAPYISAPLTVGATTVPWLTPGSIIGAGFGLHGANQLGNQVSSGYYSSNAPVSEKILTGVTTGLDMLGMPGAVEGLAAHVVSPLYRGALTTQTSLRNAYKLNRRAFKPNSEAANLNLEELRRVYHNSERFLMPEEARYLHKHGHGLRENYRTLNSVWNNQQNLSDKEINTLSDIVEHNNQLPPPPSEIQFMPDGTTRTVYNQQAQPSIPTILNGIDIRRPINGHAPGTPEWNRLNDIIAQNRQGSYLSKPKPINKSGLTKEEVLQKASAKDKDAISKMSETEFENTVLKPTGEVVPYESQANLMPHFTGSNNVFAMSPKKYADAFNERLDLLNDIIAQRNKSGVEYRVKGIDEHGNLTFYTPPGQKGKNPLIKKGLEDIEIPAGESTWSVGINPGEWRGNVEDIANTQYFRSIPGLEMRNTTGTVFSDGVPRKGTGTYEALNEYLKKLDLGRVKPGFNSQTDFSRGAWENFIKSGRAVGFYNNPGTVYGTMKSVFPYIGAGYLGYEGLKGIKAYKENQAQNTPELAKGGVIIDDRGQWAHPGQTTIIPSNKITMQGVPYPVVGVDNTGHTKMMQPGMDYTFPGQYVTEYPMMQGGGEKGHTLPEVKIRAKREYPKKNILPEVVIKAKRIKPQSNFYLNLPNPIFATNTRDKVLADRRKYYFPYETEQTKKIRDLADDQVFKSSGDLISAVHPVGSVINALYQGVDKTLPFEGVRFLPNKIPFKQAKTYNKFIPILKPASRLIDPIQMFDKLRTADSLYKSADSIDLYNQFKGGGEMIKRADGSYSRRGLWDNLRDNRGSGKAPTKEMLEQERKIRNKKQDGGEEYTYWRTQQPMVNDPSMDAISKVLLQRNLDKNFMQRAAGFGYQGGIPTRYIPGQDPDSDAVSTLLMSFGNNQVFPTIIQTGPNQLSYQPYQTQEYIEAPSWDVADYFARKGYKRAANDMYGMEYKNGGLVKYKKGKEVKSKPVAKKPVYQYTPQKFVAPSFNNLSQTTYASVPVIDTKEQEFLNNIKIKAVEERKRLAAKKLLPSGIKNMAQIINQENYIKRVEGPKAKQPYAIVDKIGNVIRYYDVNHNMVKEEKVITGESNKDVDKELSWDEFMRVHPTAERNSYIDYLQATNNKITPSGLFKLHYKDDVLENPSTKGKIADMIIPGHRQKTIDARSHTYGNSGKMFTFTSQYGIPSSKAIHGTGYEDRLAAFTNNTDRNLSNGCINVEGKTICFDFLKEGSNLYVLPEEKNDIVTFKQNLTNVISGKKDPVRNISRERVNQIRQTKKNFNDINKAANLGMTDRELNFATSIAEKESKGGRSIVSKMESNLLPGTIASSYGKFEMQKKWPWLKGGNPNNDTVALKAIRDFYRERNGAFSEDSEEDLDDARLYTEYNTGEFNPGYIWGEDYLKNLYPLTRYKNGGYVVRRSHDRKGKTHVVTGPDGTKKYFGDPNMGERGKSKYGKEAFYARHKSNLAKNPYFRAYARATWEDGGETYAIGGQSTLNPIVKKDNRNWLDYLKN